MEEALVARLRAVAAIVTVAGTFDDRPAIDWGQRQSDEATAFPAAVLKVISSGRDYDQDGASGFQRWRVRVTTFGLSYGTSKLLTRAIRNELEVAATQGSVRFHRAQQQFEIDQDPEDLSKLTVFATVSDFFLPTTTSI